MVQWPKAVCDMIMNYSVCGQEDVSLCPSQVKNKLYGQSGQSDQKNVQ